MKSLTRIGVWGERAYVMIALVLTLFVGACSHKNATAPARLRPANHNPVISSMWAFPDNVGPQDSMIVVCTASDADGDPLVYDWGTDSRFIIKGNVPADHDLYNSPNNWQVFYSNYLLPTDTMAWVACVVRDQKGGGTGQVLPVRVHP